VRILFGEIVDINDPLKNGRYRVRVFHVHAESIPVENLPWSSVLIPSTSSSKNGIGSTPRLLLGTHVIGTFIDEYSQHFLILGTFFGKNDYPEIGVENYPQNQVTITETNHSLQFNDATGEVILSNGNGNNLSLRASVDIKSLSNINLDSDADTSINVGGNLLTGSGGNSNLFANGTMNISSGSGIVLSAPKIDINPNFSFATPELTDLQPVIIKTRQSVIPLVESSTGISRKDDIIVKNVEPGNICSMATPKNLYDVAFETIDTEWNDDSINVLFEEIGFPKNTFDGEVYWGVVWLGASLKRAGYKYFKASTGFDYLIYENASTVQKELTKEELQKGDVIIFTRNNSYFVGVSDGTHNSEFDYYTCVVGDYENGVFVTDIYINDEVQVKRIFRPSGCADDKIFYNGDCTLPNIKTGFPIADNLVSLALNIYHEALSETQIFAGEKYPRGMVAAAWSVINRYDLIKKYGTVNGYRSFINTHNSSSRVAELTIANIVWAKQQYSWTLPYRIDAKGRSVGGIKNWNPTSKEKWCKCLEIANAVINREVPDPTDINNIGLGSTHYFNEAIFGKPYWYQGLIKNGWKPYQIQRHTFMIPPNTKPFA